MLNSARVFLGSRVARTSAATGLAMLAFAGNSLLCRAALKHTGIDPASFTSLRLLAGTIILYLLAGRHRHSPVKTGGWISASALFVYAAGFSFAYVSLSAATGALLLFGTVQLTMIGYGIYGGERLGAIRFWGIFLSLAGLTGLLLPGLTTPPLAGTLFMVAAGVGWGIYSLRGRGTGNPTVVTARNFARTLPLAGALSLATLPRFSFDLAGAAEAVASGALTSAIGYAIWYSALPELTATTAASVQLSVPVIAAFGGILLFGEEPSLRFALAAAAVISGIALVTTSRRGAG